MISGRGTWTSFSRIPLRVEKASAAQDASILAHVASETWGNNTHSRLQLTPFGRFELTRQNKLNVVQIIQLEFWPHVQVCCCSIFSTACSPVIPFCLTVSVRPTRLLAGWLMILLFSFSLSAWLAAL